MKGITLYDSNDKPAYRIQPLGSGHCLCYEIKYWKDESIVRNKVVKEGWKPTGKYASDVPSAYRTIAKEIETNGDWEAFCKISPKSLRDAANEFEKLLDSFHPKLDS